jgi:tRNA(fMet)-specific endonuclease VapC
VTQYILDTDHITLLQKLHPNLVRRVASIDPDDTAITIITLEEQVRGWFSVIRKYSQSNQYEKLIKGYQGLRDIVNYLSKFKILNYTLEAHYHFRELREQKIRIGTQDLRIAAISLSENSILVTRNYRDFSQIPNLRLQDWTI